MLWPRFSNGARPKEPCRTNAPPAQSKRPTWRAALRRAHAAAQKEHERVTTQTTFKRMKFELCVPPHTQIKGGPSWAAAATIALLSSACGRRVRKDTAVTGDVGPTGRIRSVGGIKEKMEGAARRGLRRMMLPRGNRAEFEAILNKRGVQPIYIGSVRDLWQLIV